MVGQVLYQFFDDDDVYYEDEVVGEKTDFSEEMNSDLRLTIYPQQLKLKTFRKSGKNQIVRQTAKINKIADLSFDVEQTVKLANFEHNSLKVDNEKENENLDEQNASSLFPLTPLPNKHFASRDTGDAKSVGFFSLAISCDKCSFCFGTKTAFNKHRELHGTMDSAKLL